MLHRILFFFSRSCVDLLLLLLLFVAGFQIVVIAWSSATVQRLKLFDRTEKRTADRLIHVETRSFVSSQTSAAIFFVRHDERECRNILARPYANNRVKSL